MHRTSRCSETDASASVCHLYEVYTDRLHGPPSKATGKGVPLVTAERPGTAPNQTRGPGERARDLLLPPGASSAAAPPAEAGPRPAAAARPRGPRVCFSPPPAGGDRGAVRWVTGRRLPSAPRLTRHACARVRLRVLRVLFSSPCESPPPAGRRTQPAPPVSPAAPRTQSQEPRVHHQRSLPAFLLLNGDDASTPGNVLMF